MRQHQVALTYSSYHTISEDGSDLGITVDALPRASYRQMLESNSIGCLTAIYDARLLGKTLCRQSGKDQDWALLVKDFETGNIALGIRQPLAKYRVKSDCVSTNKLHLPRYNWKVYFEIDNFLFLNRCALLKTSLS